MNWISFSLWSLVVMISVIMLAYWTYRDVQRLELKLNIYAICLNLLVYSIVLLLFYVQGIDDRSRLVFSRLVFASSLTLSGFIISLIISFASAQHEYRQWKFILYVVSLFTLLILNEFGFIVESVSGFKLYYGQAQIFILAHTIVGWFFAYWLLKHYDYDRSYQFRAMRGGLLTAYPCVIFVGGVLPIIIGDSRYSIISVVVFSFFLLWCIWIVLYSEHVELGHRFRELLQRMNMPEDISPALCMASLNDMISQQKQKSIENLKLAISFEGARNLVWQYEAMLDSLAEIAVPEVREFLNKHRPEPIGWEEILADKKPISQTANKDKLNTILQKFHAGQLSQHGEKELFGLLLEAPPAKEKIRLKKMLGIFVESLIQKNR